MKIIRTSITKPPRIVLYGPHGIGKSTFAANCPAPIFIQTESGLDALQVEAFELAKSWSDVCNAVDFLSHKEHNYKTIVIDSLDWAEKLLFDKVSEEAGKSIEQIPFGRGYVAAEAKWKYLLDALTYLNDSKKMLIVLLAHAQVKRFEDPERESYDRYELDLQRRSAALISEWCDILAFASLSTVVKTKEGKFGAAITKATSSGDRIVYLEERPAHDAKNRYELPHEMPLSWDAIAAEIRAKQAAKRTNLKDVQDDKRVEHLEKTTAKQKE